MNALKPEILKRFTHFGKLTASPLKTRFAVLASKANEKENTYHHQLMVGDLKELKTVLNLKESTQFIFLNDDELLIETAQIKSEIKAAKNQESFALYTYHIPSKKLKKTAEIPFKVLFQSVLSNDLILITLQATPTTVKRVSMTLKDRKADLKAHQKDKLYEDINQLPYYFNGSGFITEKRTYLGVYQLKDGTIKLITQDDFDVDHVSVNPSLDTIYFTGQPFKDFGQPGRQLYTCSVNTLKPKVEEASLNYSIRDVWFLGDKPVVLATDRKTYGNNESSQLYTLEKGLKPWLNPDLSIGNTIGSDVRYLGSKKVIQGPTITFTVTEKDHSALYQLNHEGLKKIQDVEGSLDGLIEVNDHFVAVYLGITSLQEVVTFKPHQPMKNLTRKNAFLNKEFKTFTPTPVTVDVKSHQVEGFIILPETKGNVPAILDIHGGPKTVYGAVYYHEMQVWASLGYAVFFCNPRGSDGKGDAFADLRGQYGQIDYDDFMAFTDHVLNHYPIDKDKVYITGGSYGGFMTNWAISQTHRFKAAVTQRSISNWLSFYGTSDIGSTFGVDQTGGHPLHDRDKLWDQSPLKHALKIQTPLRFIHSDQDYRCPIEQAQQLYAVLRNNGVDTDLIWFKNENHELSRSGKPHARIKRLYAIQDWFKKYGGHR